MVLFCSALCICGLYGIDHLATDLHIEADEDIGYPYDLTTEGAWIASPSITE